MTAITCILCTVVQHRTVDPNEDDRLERADDEHREVADGLIDQRENIYATLQIKFTVCYSCNDASVQ